MRSTARGHERGRRQRGTWGKENGPRSKNRGPNIAALAGITRDPPSPPCMCCRTRSTSPRSEEHTSELQSHSDLVCRLLLEKKKTKNNNKTQLTANRHCHLSRKKEKQNMRKRRRRSHKNITKDKSKL